MADQSPLIVPVDVHALVFSSPAQSFRRWEMNYAAQDYFLSPEPLPFSGGRTNFGGPDTPDEALGVYLQWTLPEALRHATADEQYAPLAYPLVPNRWLIVRQTTAATAPYGRAATAWVVESDYLDPDDGSSAFLDPQASASVDPATFSERYPRTRLGRVRALDGWGEPGGATFLTAIGPANPLFAAYQPHGQNVFSFHDDLVTQNIDADTLSYLVVGWYSAEGDGPLASGLAAGDAFAEVMADLQWSAPDEDATAASTVYSGTALGVAWTPEVAPTVTQIVYQPLVGVGNTSMDALASLVEASTGPGTPYPSLNLDDAALQAFLYNLYDELDLPNGDVVIDQQIHATWFETAKGGTYWTLVQQETVIGQPPPPQPTATQLDFLDQLNQAQHTLDQSGWDLLALQQKLYEMWWKNGYAQGYTPLFTDPYLAPAASLAAQLDPATPGTLAAQVYAQLSTVAENQATVTGLLAQYQSLLDADDTLPQLKALSKPNFSTPTDPVILIAGIDQPFSINPYDFLPCRFPDDLVTAVTLADYGNAVLTAAEVASLVPSIDASALPGYVGAVLPGLMTESFLLDPTNAGGIAYSVYEDGQSSTLQAIQSSIVALDCEQNEAPDCAETAAEAVTGMLPAFYRAVWSQPWLPLFLEWQVEWYPIPFADDGAPLWRFDGQEYQWTTPLEDTPEPTVLSGRSILTPKSSFDFKSRLEQYLKDYPTGGGPLGDLPDMTLADLEAAVDIIDGWDLLSQALNGFTAQLAMRREAAGLLPDDSTPLLNNLTLADLIGPAHHDAPLSRMIKPPPGLTAADPPPFYGFEAMRCGQFFFRALRVVDAFGQSRSLVTPSSSDALDPIPADDYRPVDTVTSVEPYRFVQLPPRLLQAARFNFDLVAAADQTQPSFLHSTADPVCGWLLPNHLDEGLSVYAPDGTSLGEIGLMMQPDGTRTTVWRASPDAPDPSTINAHIDGFVGSLSGQPAETFTAFLATIDETLWTIDPLGGRSDAFLSVLMGRPLALVRARLAFELQTDPLADPAWPWTLDPQPTTFPEYAFPVRLGDQQYREDGLLGYYLGPDGETDYDTFFAIHDAEQAGQGYITPITPENYPTLKFDGTTEVFATLVLDPRAAVYAYSALLPVKILMLPQGYVDAPLANMALTFRTGPLLTRLVPDADGTETVILMPRPAEQSGTWGWQERTVSGGEQVWDDPIPLAPTDDQANLSSALPSLREGLLVLRDAVEEND